MVYQVKVKSYIQRDQIHTWLMENNITEYSMWISAYNTGKDAYMVEFDHYEDFMAFKLTWE